MDAGLEVYLLTTDEAAMVLNMRGQTVNGIKMCFASIYQNDKMCKLGCQTEDTLEHIFECEKLNGAKTSSFEAVFGSVTNQKEAAAAFTQRLAVRSRILEAGYTSTPATPGGAGGIAACL